MRLRLFEEKDFEVIKDWIPDERGHAMWCANRFQYPLDKTDFLSVLSDVEGRHGDSPFVVTMDDDVPVGFFCYSVNHETKEGMFKFVVVAPDGRGKGIAGEMFRLALSYAFDETKVNAVHLIVFSVNGRAKKFYEKVGFEERKTDHKAFVYKGEHWARCNMIIRKDHRNGPIRRLPVCMVMIMLSAALLLTGCVSGEGEQKKAGRNLMNEYFQNAGKKASVESIYADVTRPAADRLEMSDYVKGNYRLGKDSYEFWANVETGSIYTSERLMEFGESVLKLQADRLGLDADCCTCYAAVTIEPEFTGEMGNSRGQTDTVTLNDMLPVSITDMDAFAKEALESEYVSVRSFIVCRSNPLSSDAKELSFPEWKNGQITVCEMPDQSADLPMDKYDILGFWSEHRDVCMDLKFE